MGKFGSQRAALGPIRDAGTTGYEGTTLQAFGQPRVFLDREGAGGMNTPPRSGRGVAWDVDGSLGLSNGKGLFGRNAANTDWLSGLLLAGNLMHIGAGYPNVAFYTSSSPLEVARVHSTGLAIGLTPDLTPVGRLDLLASGDDDTVPVVRFRQANSSDHGVDIGVDSGNHGELSFWTNNAGTRVRVLSIDRTTNRVWIGSTTPNPSYLLQLDTDSAAKPGTTAWTVPSDGRLKQNVRPFTDGLAALAGVQPVRYRYNGKDGTPAGSAGVGVIAQDAAPHLPDCVSTNEHGYLAFNPHALQFVMVNAINELAAQVQALTARVAALEGGPNAGR